MEKIKKIQKLRLTTDQLSGLRGGIISDPGITPFGANKNKAQGCNCDNSGNNDNNKNKAYECGCQG